MASSRRKTRTGVGIVLFLLLACSIVFYRNFHRVVVSGKSMEPTFHSGDGVFVSRAYWLVGPIKDKDIVVVKDPNPDGFIIKRVYKMGGETVDWLNVPKNWSLQNGPYVVPEGKIYLLGDNRTESEDSRAFGPRDASWVLGKVVAWPR
jgi:signal peptidase I